MYRRPLPLLVTLALLPCPAVAQAPDTVRIEDLSWTELRDRIQGGSTTAIIPVGGVEQSGPDIALGKHDARARVLADRIARELGDALVAPVVAFVPEGGIEPPTSHMRFPGTLTVPPAVFRATVGSVAESLKLHGFKAVVLIGEHGSYQGDLAAVAADLNRKWAASPAKAYFVPEYYRAATVDFAATLRAHGYSDAEIGTHAGVADTSLTMALAPGEVRQGGLASGAGLDAAHGVYGDPRRSTAELGKLGADGVVEKTVAAIRADLAHGAHPRR